MAEGWRDAPPRRSSMSGVGAGVAQQVEQTIRNRQVIGSNPIAGSSFFLSVETAEQRPLVRPQDERP